MNMLDQMNFGDYRAPCNVEESKADIWKLMGEKYKKNSEDTNNKKKNWEYYFLIATNIHMYKYIFE